MYDEQKVKRLFGEFLSAIGQTNWQKDQHLQETPARVAKMYKILLEDSHQLKDLIKTFKCEEDTPPVMINSIPFYSFCAHHLLPFYGKISIAYIPDKKIIGLSKLARVARHFAKRPQVQEQLTKQICDALQTSVLNPKGVYVVVDAQHNCIGNRGVRAMGAKTRTQYYTGLYKTNSCLRTQFEDFVNFTKENLFEY